MPAHTHDDGFREIQLNGKQLVFFFMAATVVLVVVFLCGVLVGRGVRTERGGTVAEASFGVPNMEPAAAPSAPVAPPAGSDPTKAAPPQAPEDLTYNKVLGNANPPVEVFKPPAKNEKPSSAPVPQTTNKAAPPAPAAPEARVAPVAPPKDAPVAPPKDATPSPAAPGGTTAPSSAVEPKGSPYVVQVAALNVRSEADAIAKRLTSKGYDAYVIESAPGAPLIFRVRVGKFGSRREAQTMAGKLQKEEQFKPWVTR